MAVSLVITGRRYVCYYVCCQSGFFFFFLSIRPLLLKTTSLFTNDDFIIDIPLNFVNGKKTEKKRPDFLLTQNLQGIRQFFLVEL